jgi:pimeloyl-ACP methyl ester carboxylesterase
MNKMSIAAGLAYWTYGKKIHGKRVLLMIHGLGGDHNDLSLLAQRLKTQVVVPDLPGFGASEAVSEHSAAAHVRQLSLFTDAIKLNEFDVLGHSLGSTVGLLLAGQSSVVKKLVLLNPVPEQTAATKGFLTMTVGKMSKENQEKFIHTDLYNVVAFSMASHNRFSMRHTQSYIQQQRLRRDTFSFRAWEESIQSVSKIDHFSGAKKVNAQTLIIDGDKDRIVGVKSVQRFTNCFRNATLQRLPDAGHFTPSESRRVIAPIIDQFLL